MDKEQNELLTRIGPGTRMGSLLRRYWQVVAAAEEMNDRWTKRVRVLGEDLLLFKDKAGRFGLVSEFCPHRRASLAYGIPTDEGIRCAYHGWTYNREGRCVAQPNEGERHALKDKIATTAYPVQDMAGLLWAYLGPQPAPLLPRFDGFVAEGAIRTVATVELPCNWLQIMENSVDPVHVESLHGAVTEFLYKDEGLRTAFSRHHVKIGFDEFEYGIIKRRLVEGQPDDSQDWTVGHPLVFPQMVSVGNMGQWQQYSFEIRIPIDDTHTRHYWYHAFVPDAATKVPPRLQDRTFWYEPALTDENGQWKMRYIPAQDAAMWVTQGPVAERSEENLGASDQGVVLFRRMLLREIEKIERGEDPIGTVRDPEQNTVILLPMEVDRYLSEDGFRMMMDINICDNPITEDLLRLFTGAGSTDKARQLTPA